MGGARRFRGLPPRTPTRRIGPHRGPHLTGEEESHPDCATCRAVVVEREAETLEGQRRIISILYGRLHEIVVTLTNDELAREPRTLRMSAGPDGLRITDSPDLNI